MSTHEPTILQTKYTPISIEKEPLNSRELRMETFITTLNEKTKQLIEDVFHVYTNELMKAKKDRIAILATSGKLEKHEDQKVEKAASKGVFFATPTVDARTLIQLSKDIAVDLKNKTEELLSEMPLQEQAQVRAAEKEYFLLHHIHSKKLELDPQLQETLRSYFLTSGIAQESEMSEFPKETSNMELLKDLCMQLPLSSGETFPKEEMLDNIALSLQITEQEIHEGFSMDLVKYYKTRVLDNLGANLKMLQKDHINLHYFFPKKSKLTPEKLFQKVEVLTHEINKKFLQKISSLEHELIPLPQDIKERIYTATLSDEELDVYVESIMEEPYNLPPSIQKFVTSLEREDSEDNNSSFQISLKHARIKKFLIERQVENILDLNEVMQDPNAGLGGKEFQEYAKIYQSLIRDGLNELIHEIDPHEYDNGEKNNIAREFEKKQEEAYSLISKCETDILKMFMRLMPEEGTSFIQLRKYPELRGLGLIEWLQIVKSKKAYAPDFRYEAQVLATLTHLLHTIENDEHYRDAMDNLKNFTLMKQPKETTPYFYMQDQKGKWTFVSEKVGSPIRSELPPFDERVWTPPSTEENPNPVGVHYFYIDAEPKSIASILIKLLVRKQTVSMDDLYDYLRRSIVINHSEEEIEAHEELRKSIESFMVSIGTANMKAHYAGNAKKPSRKNTFVIDNTRKAGAEKNHMSSSLASPYAKIVAKYDKYGDEVNIYTAATYAEMLNKNSTAHHGYYDTKKFAELIMIFYPSLIFPNLFAKVSRLYEKMGKFEKEYIHQKNKE